MNSIILKNLDLTEIIKNNSLLTIKELLNKVNYKLDNIYIDKFWYNIKDDKWLYLDNDLILWLEYKDIKVGKEKIIKFLKNHFIEKEDFKILTNSEFDLNNFCFTAEEKQKYDKEKRGAHNKQYITVSSDCFKELCMYVGTNKSKEIKKYYIQLEKVFKFYLEYQNEYRKFELNNKNIELDNTIKNIKLDKHKYLIEKFNCKQCVYVIEININSLERLIKIGSTKNIKKRIEAMKLTYMCECILLDIYECENNYREIEQYILSNEEIRDNLYKEKINNTMPKEIIKLSDDFNYDQLIHIIKNNIKKNIYLNPVQLLEKQKMDLVNRLLDNGYNPNLFENFTINIIVSDIGITKDETKKEECCKCTKEMEPEIKLENNIEEKIINEFYKNKQSDINIEENLDTNDSVNEDIEEESVNEEEESKNFSFKIKNTRGRKIQKINPNNLDIVIQIYDSMIHVLRSNDGIVYSKGCIQQAIKNNTLYKGFRWCFVEKYEDPNISKAQPTNNTISSRITEPIAKMNESKTEIIDIYNSQEECFLNNGLTKSKLKELISFNKLYHNVYFIKISDCDSDILHKYNIGNSLFKKQTKSKSVIAINPLTKEETIFKTISEIPIKLGGTSCSINSAIKNKTIYNGYFWKTSN